MEQIVREVTPLSHAQYASLAMPEVLRQLPDYVVLDRGARTCSMVDVAYRSNVTKGVKERLRLKVDVLGDLILVLFHGGTVASGSKRELYEVVRCCRLRRSPRGPDVELVDPSTGAPTTLTLNQVLPGDLWQGMLPLKALFGHVDDVDPGMEAAVEAAARAFAA